jgi:hypothetical protein
VIPPEIDRYGSEVDRVLREILGDRLVGSWFVGSVALDGYRPGASDVDIAAVALDALTDGEKHRVVAAVSHSALPCPARGLELVVYRGVGAATSPRAGGQIELNLNSGPGLEERVDLDARLVPTFWFVIDRAVAHRRGLAISGPPAAEVFTEPARAEVLQAMLESIRWHRAPSRDVDAAVLNAARAWRFAETDVLGTKVDGASWARSRTRHAEVVRAVADPGPAPSHGFQHHEVDGFLDEAERALRASLPEV